MEKVWERYSILNECKENIAKAEAAIIDAYTAGRKLLLCGNGGSAADCDHIAGELGKGFLSRRPLGEGKRNAMKAGCPALDDGLLSSLQDALPAISLPSMTALMTAFSNDVDPMLIFAQGVLALGKAGDVLVAISTSGNSKNVVAAAKVAKGLGLTVIALTGEGGGALGKIADITVAVPETETFKIQELHLPVYHYLCAAVEEHFFK